MTELEKELGRARQAIFESVANTGKRVLILRKSRGSDKNIERNYEIARTVADGVFTALVCGMVKEIRLTNGSDIYFASDNDVKRIQSIRDSQMIIVGGVRDERS